MNTPVFIDSAKIKKSGKFSFKVKAGEPDFYQVGYSESDFMTLLAEPGEKIKLDFGSPRTLQGLYGNRFGRIGAGENARYEA